MKLKFIYAEVKAGTSRRHIRVLLLIFFSVFSINQCHAAPIAVGDSLGGGTVFCVSQTPDTSKCVTTGSGDYGLIMANVDQANYDSSNHGVTWSSENKKTYALSNDNGAANTAAIITVHPNDNGTNNAAWLCHNYDKEKGRVGFTDWYLPAENELNKIYLYVRANNLIGRDCTGKKDDGVQCLLGGDNENMWYWSSTEDSGGSKLSAWRQSFNSGIQLHGLQLPGFKILHHFAVRAVRAFNNSTIQQFINEMRDILYGVLEQMPIELIDIMTSYATEVPSRDMLRNTECLTKKAAN